MEHSESGKFQRTNTCSLFYYKICSYIMNYLIHDHGNQRTSIPSKLCWFISNFSQAKEQRIEIELWPSAEKENILNLVAWNTSSFTLGKFKISTCSQGSYRSTPSLRTFMALCSWPSVQGRLMPPLVLRDPHQSALCEYYKQAFLHYYFYKFSISSSSHQPQ